MVLTHRTIVTSQSRAIVSRQNGPQLTMAQAERISDRNSVSLEFYIIIQMSPALTHFHGLYYHDPTGGIVSALMQPRCSVHIKLFFSSHHSMAMPSIDTVPDGDDKNLQRPPHDTQGDTGTSDDPADDSQPLDINENSTAYSLPRWRKLLRSVFGMQQRGFQVGVMLTRCSNGGVSH